MGQHHIQSSATIDAPVTTIYAILSDYHKGHQAILPKRYFTNLTVLKGGQGSGTIAQVEMNVFGAKQVLNMVISEPEPGRILVETDREAGVVTTFTLDPTEDLRRTQVTISTVMEPSSGLRGLFEKMLNPPIIRRIYRQELQLLADFAAKKDYSDR